MADKTRQYTSAETGRRARLLLLVAALLIGIALIASSVLYQRLKPYEPPAFDLSAQMGLPSPPDDLGYALGSASQEGGFQLGLASKWQRTEAGTLPIWFTNPEENDVYLMLQIVESSSDKLIYESGLVRPGEYVESLAPLSKLSNSPINATLSVYSFDPEDFSSHGTVRISGVIS